MNKIYDLINEEVNADRKYLKERKHYLFTILPAVRGFNYLLSLYNNEDDFEIIDSSVKNNDYISLFLYQARKEYFRNMRILENFSKGTIVYPNNEIENVFKVCLAKRTIISFLLTFIIAFIDVDEDSPVYAEYSKFYGKLFSVCYSNISFYKDETLNVLSFLENNKNIINLNISNDIQDIFENNLKSKMNRYMEGMTSNKRIKSCV